MARRKKRRDLSPRSPSKKKDSPFNPALRPLRTLKPGSQEQGFPEPETGKSGMTSLPDPRADEDGLFMEAMSGVKPLPREKPRIATDPDLNTRPAHPPNLSDLETLAHLSDLVSGTAEMDIRFSDEYIEGSVKGFDKRLMQKLKKGLFPIQDHVDLHGLKKEEAESVIRDFLLRCYRAGLRCVLVVHGRGLNSKDHIPVLKKRIPLWLSRGPVRKIILAFSTARTYDGGTGAIYVLLKRSRGRVQA